LCAAAAIIASSVSRSPLLALTCCLAALLSYQKGAGIGIVGAIIVIALAFMVDPFVVHPVSIKIFVSVLALAIVSVIGGEAFGRLVPDGVAPRAAPTPTRSVRGLETPARGSRTVAEPRRSLAIEAEPESNVEQETISRFLREMRDEVGGDDIVLWRYLRESD